MLMPIPDELKVLCAILLLAAIYFAVVSRSDWTRDGQFDYWRPLEDTVSHFLMLAMVVTSSLQIVVRYVFADDISMPWTEEFSRLVMVWAALWGAAALQRSDDHITMSIVYDLLPPAAQTGVRLFGYIVTAAVLLPIIWLGWKTAASLSIMSTISLGLPLSIFAYSIPIAGALMLLHTLSLMVALVRGRHAPMNSADWSS